MNEAPIFYEVNWQSLNHQGEELCGDQVKVLRTTDQTIVVLSDGLGSGVKASILAQLTTEIILTMLRAEAPLPEVIETVTGTLPICKVRGIAYATFVVLQIRHATGEFRLVNSDSPPVFLMKRGRIVPLESRTETQHGRRLNVSEGRLELGDFIGIISDGVIWAGPGVIMNPNWSWNHIAAWLQKTARVPGCSASALVRSVMEETRRLYGDEVGDDATFAGIQARLPRRLMVLTGPPVDRARDRSCAQRLQEFEGRKIVCGGTTGNLVADYLGQSISTDMASGYDEIPPVGQLPGVDLVTEGILTMARALQLLKDCEGEAGRLPAGRHGGLLLARELLQADSIFFLVGESVNPYYQNPMLPRSVSIRHNLVIRLVELLTQWNKAVETEWC
jgi:hypothetical protein